MNPSNYSTISFPFLGLEMDPGRGFSIGPLNIHYYGVIIAIGLMLAVLYGCKRSREFGLKQDDVLDGVLWITPFAIICARLYYCIFSWDQYAADPISILYIWQGGLAIYGGVLGAAAGIILFCKKHNSQCNKETKTWKRKSLQMMNADNSISQNMNIMEITVCGWF